MSIRDCIRQTAAPLAAVTLLVSSILWVRTWAISHTHPETPVCAVHLPSFFLQTCAREDGVHFLAVLQNTVHFASIQFRPATFFGSSGYHVGSVVNILGLVIAISPFAHTDGDSHTAPYAAAVLPYWLLIVGSGSVLIVNTAAAAWLRRCGRLSTVSGMAAAGVVALFAVLNLIPSAWRPGASIQPQSLEEWVTLMFSPHTAYSELMVIYGFPFSFWHRGIINGQYVDQFYGATVGWEPHKFMDNLCTVTLLAFGVALATEWLRRVRSNASNQPGIDKP